MNTVKNISLKHKKKLIFFGIFLPVYSLLIEFFFGISAEAFLNPIPSVFHAGLILLVPLTALITLKVIKTDYLAHPRILGAMLGASLCSCLVYSILFIPILPIFVMMLVYSVAALGIPLVLGLPMIAPLGSLFSLLNLWSKSTKSFPHLGAQLRVGRISGFLVCLLIIGSLEFRTAYTSILLERLIKNPVDVSTIESFRKFGQQEKLLELAYKGSSRIEGFYEHVNTSISTVKIKNSLFNFDNLHGGRKTYSMNIEDARRLYFQVSGRAFNKVNAPKARGFNSWFWDNDLGEQKVGGKVPDLYLTHSSINGSINSEAALSYFEWTFEFTNNSLQQNEARAVISLPPGSFISRATLWVNGEEEEAVFAPKGQAVAAYKSIVKRKQDPLLLTFAGKDQIMLQCFPIAAKGGKMKIRLGINSPLVLTKSKSNRQYLPFISENNFNLSEQLSHQFWFESKGYISSKVAGTTNEQFDGGHAVRGSTLLLEDQEILVQPGKERTHTARDAISGDWVVQNLAEIGRSRGRTFVVVIDGSANMKKHVKRLADTIEELFADKSGELDITAFIAGDSVTPVLGNFTVSNPENIDKLYSLINNYPYKGGADNGAALLTAWDLAAQRSGSTILWFHAGQPVEFASFENLKNRYERRRPAPLLISLPLSDQMNKLNNIFGSLDLYKPMHPKQLGDMELLSDLIFSDVHLERYFSRTMDQPVVSRHSTSHLPRLAVQSEVQELLINSNIDSRNKAAELASRYSILSEVSAAVALENESQYAENGLNKSSFGIIPSVPEPSTYAILALSFIFLVFILRLKLLEPRGL